jgi:hypothetical protein
MSLADALPPEERVLLDRLSPADQAGIEEAYALYLQEKAAGKRSDPLWRLAQRQGQAAS